MPTMTMTRAGVRMGATVALLCAALAVTSMPAHAQTPEPTFVLSANLGAQSHNHTFTAHKTFTLFDEAGTVDTDHSVGGGFMFDFGAAYRVWSRLALGMDVSFVSDSDDASFVAAVPDPAFFDQLRTGSGTAELDRSEIAYHIQTIWTLPTPNFFPDNSRIALILGPSIFTVDQQYVTSATVSGSTATPTVESESDTGLGVNAGFDFTMPVNPRYGVGVFVRYAGGSVDADAVPDMKVGGFQFGAGIRVTY